MRRRTKRDLGIFLGVIALIGGVAFFNAQIQRGNLAAEMEALRTSLENARRAEGTRLLDWHYIRATKGSLRGGGEFHDRLHEVNGQIVNLLGFMVPQEEFRNVTEFLLLPIPIECYFCAMPPDRDVMLVQLAEGETAQIYEEPVMINGRFTLHEGPGQRFYYSMQNALVAPAEQGGELTRKRLEIEHMAPEHERDPSMLLPGISEEPKDTD